MFQRINQWIERYLASDEAVGLFFILVGSVLTFWILGNELAPVFGALVIAFILQGAVSFLSRKLPEAISIYLVYVSFLTISSLVVLMLLPLVWRQLASLVNNQLPLMLSEARLLVLMLPERYPDMVSQEQAVSIVEYASAKLAATGQGVLSFSISKIPNLMALLVYMILVPLLVFFFLKDKDILRGAVVKFLPKDRPRMHQIWLEMDAQITNYIRGKFIEIMIIGGVSYLCFMYFDLNYAALLALLVGLSVVVPYVGATVVTLPVVAVAYLQFGYGGWGSEFLSVVLAYLLIQVLDGNVLVPILFSEAVNLHPVAIIVAILVFGGLWGFWGVFFAIPLATLIKALYNSWPERGEYQEQASQ
jgi:putative permease